MSDNNKRKAPSNDENDTNKRSKTENSLNTKSDNQSFVIIGLVRPLLKSDVVEYLEEHGSLTSVTLNKYRSKAFVVFSNATAAQTAFKAVDGAKWPDHNKGTLSCTWSNNPDSIKEPDELFNFTKTQPKIYWKKATPPAEPTADAAGSDDQEKE